MVNFGVEVYSWDALPRQNFVQIEQENICPFGENLYQKLPFLAIFRPEVHIFKITMVKFGVRVRTWDFFPHTAFRKNCLRGYTPLG